MTWGNESSPANSEPLDLQVWGSTVNPTGPWDLLGTRTLPADDGPVPRIVSLTPRTHHQWVKLVPVSSQDGKSNVTIRRAAFFGSKGTPAVARFKQWLVLLSNSFIRSTLFPSHSSVSVHISPHLDWHHQFNPTHKIDSEFIATS